MRTKYLLFLLGFFLGIAVELQAQLPGEDCTTAIPLGENYHETISGSGDKVVWYTAWTFDLPLSVTFTPMNEDDPAPEVEMDFTCTPGWYKDSVLCSLFCENNENRLKVDLPYRPPLEVDRDENDKLIYFLAIGKTYRNLLLSVGISENKQVFVKVTYHAPGTIQISPEDLSFKSCMNGAEFFQFGDTIRVKQNDSSRYVIVPYVQWQYDSIYYYWDGERQAKIRVGPTCGFDPGDDLDETILQRKTIRPGDSLKVTSKDIQNYVQKSENGSGMFYLKCLSTALGELRVKPVPQAPPEGGAIALKYGRREMIKPNDTTTLYAIPHTWDTATIFTSPTNHIVRMYVSTKPDFYTTQALKSYQFQATDDGHKLEIFQEEMKDLWTLTNKQYLYVRFLCTARTTVLPEIWEVSDCMYHSTELNKKQDTLSIVRYTSGAQFYRVYYKDWSKGNLTLQWKSTSESCDAYIGDSCFFKPSDSEKHVIKKETIRRRGGTWTITPEMFAEWEDRVDPDGYLYMLIYSESSRTEEMVITSEAPEEEDPVYPHTSIHVACEEGTSNVIVTVSKPQHIVVSGIGFNEEWDALPDSPKTLTLPTGEYMLQGTKEDSSTEQLVITIP